MKTKAQRQWRRIIDGRRGGSYRNECSRGGKTSKKEKLVFHLVTVAIKKSSRSQIKQCQWESETGGGSQG